MKSPLKSLCCFSNAKDEDPLLQGEADVTAVQDSANAADGFNPVPVLVTSHSQEDVVSSEENMATPKEATKGHKRTPSEASSPVALTANGLTPKVSFSSNSTSSYKSSTSVLTAIERPHGLTRLSKEGSTVSVATAIEITPSPKAVKKDVEESMASGEIPTSKNGMASQESKVEPEVEASEVSKESVKSPTSPLSKSGVSSPESKGVKEADASDEEAVSAASPAKSDVTEEEGIPADVTTLDDVDKLNELIDSEKFDLKHPFWDKISLFYGDITKINVDAIVNAANDRLGGGGGVDGAIHRAAGYNQLQAECRKHDRPVATGQAVITDACKLSTHVKKIIHCVGPICYGGVTKEKRNKLESCYRRAIELSEENGLRSIAFCCISTGIYGYDNKDAARSVIKLLYKHLSKEENAEKWDRVVLCLFMDIDKQCYRQFISQLVRNPTMFDEEDESEEEEEDDDEKKKKKRDEDDEKKEETDEKRDGEDKEKKKEQETTDEKEAKTEKKKKDGKDETDAKESSKMDVNESKKSADKDDIVENMDENKTDNKAGKSTVEGEESNVEETSPSASDTNGGEKTMEEEQDGGKVEGEKESSVIDDMEKEDGSIVKKRAPSEENEGQPPIKREKIERESAV